MSSTRLRRWVRNQSDPPNAAPTDTNQKLIQKHSQKMGQGSVFWSARFWGDQALDRRTAHLQRRRLLSSAKERDFRGRTIGRALEGRRLVPPFRCRSMMNRGVNDPPPGRAV